MSEKKPEEERVDPIQIWQKFEDGNITVWALQDHLVSGIMWKLGLPKEDVEQVLYRTCVSTSSRAIDAAHIINEFLIHLDDLQKEVQAQ